MAAVIIAQSCFLFLTLSVGYCWRHQWKFPQFNINPDGNHAEIDDSDKLSALWYEQAITGLMATIGTRLQQEISPKSQTSLKLEKCIRKVENSIQYAKCLVPVIRQKRLLEQWRKNRANHKNKRRTRREIRKVRASILRNDTTLEKNSPSKAEAANSPNATSKEKNEKSVLTEIADWLTGAIAYAKKNGQEEKAQNLDLPVSSRNENTRIFDEGQSKRNPKAHDHLLIDNPVEKFVKRTFAPELFGNLSGPDAWNSKPLTRQAMLANVTRSLDNFLKTHGYANKSNAPVANEIVPLWQIDLLENVHELIVDVTKQAQTQAQAQQIQQPKATVKILSPRFLSLDSDQGQYDTQFLSPDFLSLTDNGLGSIPQMLKSVMDDQSKEAWLRLIMEASGVNDMLRGDKRMLETILKSGKANENFEDNMSEFSRVFDEVNKKFEQSFKKLYATVTTSQIERMERRGFAYMSKDQIQYIYNSSESPCQGQHDCAIQFNLTQYEKMSDHQKDDAVLDFILELAEADQINSTERRRQKRTLFLTPVKFTPAILKPKATSMPIILSPIIFSPVILSPSLLGPIILSPAIFSPIILTPFLLGALILSPAVAKPLILSPLALFPTILSPEVLTPLILVPYILSPVILSPVVLSPSILRPNALSPLILDPGVLSPSVLRPSVLSPIIFSPQVLGALILSPGALSPIIGSPVALFAVILSPQFLG